MTVLEEMEDWSQVLTEDGYIGYIRNSSLRNFYPTQRILTGRRRIYQPFFGGQGKPGVASD